MAADRSYSLTTDAERVRKATAASPTMDFETPWGGAEHPILVLDVDRSGGSAANAASYQLPLDDVSPLWGKTWREIGIDAFANHHTQGISAFLGSSFFHRPIALVAENGEKINPASLAQPLHNLGGDGAGGTTANNSGSVCAQNAFFCPVLKHAEDELEKARQDALSLHWKEACAEIALAAKEVTSLYPGGGHAAHWVAGDPKLIDLHSVQRRLDRALTLAAGLEIVAEADRSDVVAGEEFTVTAEVRCRKEANCTFGKLQLVLPSKAEQSASATDANASQKFKLTINESVPPADIWQQQQPEPPPVAVARQETSIEGYTFAADQPVTHIVATSTRIDRIAIRMVPAYTLAVEPDEAIELLAGPKNPSTFCCACILTPPSRENRCWRHRAARLDCGPDGYASIFGRWRSVCKSERHSAGQSG